MRRVRSFFPDDIERGERRRVGVVIILALLALSLPYLWALAITPPGASYGGLLYNPDDQNVHLAWAQQAPGSLTIRDLFTTESLHTGEPPRFINLFCYALGTVAALTHLPLVVVYHLFRLVFAALCLYWFYLLCSRLTEDRRARLVALWLAAFGLGTGWLKDVLPQALNGRILFDRPDLPNFPMMPEAFTFSSAFVFPLNIASMALLAFIFLKVIEGQTTMNRRAIAQAAGAGFLLANIHTYDVIPLGAVLLTWCAYLSLRHRGQSVLLPWLVALTTIIGTLPPLAYQVWVFRVSDEFHQKAVTATPAPPRLDVLLTYGLLLAFAAVGLIAARRERGSWLAALWAVVVFAAIYAPVSFARKMIEGVHLPLCFLAALGICCLTARLRSVVVRRAVLGTALVLLCASSAQFVVWCLHNAQDNNRSRGVAMPPLYLSAGDAAALRHLKAQPPGVVLCLSFLGNYVPRATGHFTYIGHWAETLNMKSKMGETLHYYDGKLAPSQALDWLRFRHITYVIEGNYEHMLSQERNTTLPSARMGLEPIFEANGTTVYRVPPVR